MRNKKTLEDEINEFMNVFGCKELIAFLRDVIPLFELYDIRDEQDWERVIEDEDERNVQLLRTVYLVSVIAHQHASVLCHLKAVFPKLWMKMENQAKKQDMVKI